MLVRCQLEKLTGEKCTDFADEFFAENDNIRVDGVIGRIALCEKHSHRMRPSAYNDYDVSNVATPDGKVWCDECSGYYLPHEH